MLPGRRSAGLVVCYVLTQYSRASLAGAVVKNLAYLALNAPNAIFGISRNWASRPVVFDDVETICPELRALERSYDAIREEYLAVRNSLDRVRRYHELDGLQRELSASPSESKNWRVFFLDVMGRKPEDNCRRCPATADALSRIPGLFQAFFSILEGGKSIAPHSSPYWGYLRYHLALEVPDNEPQPRMRVHNRWITWTEGKGFLFDDTWDHELVNENPELRSVLIVDIARPMSPVGNAVHAVATFILRHTYARWVVRRSGG